MTTNDAEINDIDRYIMGFPMETQKLLMQMRAAIVKAAPEAIELISYGMPGYKYKGTLVFFAAFKNHIGFYALPTALIAFKEELSIYKSAKGSVQFPIDKPLPLSLITRIVKFRVKENLAKAANKEKKIDNKKI